MEMISAAEGRYVHQFHDIDISQVGAVIGQGSEHLVRSLGTSSVLKIPLAALAERTRFQRLFHPLTTAQDQRKQQEIVQDYFEDYAVNTTILENREGLYCLVQPFVHFDTITHEHLQADTETDIQMRDIAERHRHLVRGERKFLDLLGHPGQGKTQTSPFIHNLVLDQSQNVKILDPYLHPIPNIHPRSWYARTLWGMTKSHFQSLGYRLA